MNTRDSNRERPAYASRPRQYSGERLFRGRPTTTPAWDSGDAAFAEVESGEVEALLRVERSA